MHVGQNKTSIIKKRDLIINLKLQTSLKLPFRSFQLCPAAYNIEEEQPQKVFFYLFFGPRHMGTCIITFTEESAAAAAAECEAPERSG